MKNVSHSAKLLIAVLITAAPYFTYGQESSGGTLEIQKTAVGTGAQATSESIAQITTDAKNLDAFRKSFFAQDIAVQSFSVQPAAKPSSLWESNQKRRLHSAIAGKKYDVIVLPLQQEIISYDKTARLLVARFLADDIRRQTRMKVMPVELVHRLLGEHKYKFADSDVKSLMAKFDIKFSVSLFIRSLNKVNNKDPLAIYFNNEKNNYRDNVLVAVLSSGDQIENVYQIAGVSPNDTNSLSSLVTDSIPEFASRLFEKHQKDASSTEASEFDFELPQTLETIGAGSGAIYHAAYFQLLGILTPEIMEGERKRYFERSLVALRQAPKDTPEFVTLKSRALFYLYRRPEALKLIQPAQSSAQSALFSYLNGNYYDLEKKVKNIQQPLFQIFSYIETKRLATEYEITTNVEEPNWLSDEWRNLIDYASNDIDKWDVRENGLFYESLSGLFPAFDDIYAETITKNASVNLLKGEFKENGLLFASVLGELEKLQKSSLCCVLDDARLSMFDVTHFYLNLGLANILKSLNKKVNKQQLVDSANILFDKTSAMLEGQRTYSRLRAESLATEMENANSIEQPKIVKNLYDLSTEIVVGSSTTDRNYVRANRLRHQFFNTYKRLFSLDEKESLGFNKLIHDWPSAVAYAGNVNFSHRIDYTNSDFGAAARLHSALSGDNADLFLEEIKARFDGHPEKVKYLSGVLEKKGDRLEAEKLLRAAANQGTHSWEVYEKLTRILWTKGDFEEASKVAISYPGFQSKSRDNAVAIANRAAGVGDLFFWKGATEIARTFYNISAGLNTGAYSSLTSAQRLALIDGKLIEAAQIVRMNATRYNSSYRYRDYISYLYMFGLNYEAETLFQDLVKNFDDPHIWSALFVGDRVTAKKLAEVTDSLSPYIGQRSTMRTYAQRYMIMHAFIDRIISEESLDKVISLLSDKQFDQQYPKAVYSNRLSSFLQPNLRDRIVNSELPGVSMSASEESCVSLPCYQVDVDYSRVPTKHQLFAQAYYSFKQENYKKSFEIFSTYDFFFEIYAESEEVTLGSEILPYVTISAVEVGRESGVATYLKAEFEDKSLDTFDYRMSKAILSASQGDLDNSLSHLEKGFLLMPHIGKRNIFTWYQLLEVSEWIFGATQDSSFLEFALSRARDLQKVHPVYSWSYAFEAKYSSDEKRQVRATAIAGYLDSDSYWLQSVPDSVKERAHVWMKTNNPFDTNKPPATSKET